MILRACASSNLIMARFIPCQFWRIRGPRPARFPGFSTRGEAIPAATRPPWPPMKPAHLVTSAVNCVKSLSRYSQRVLVLRAGPSGTSRHSGESRNPEVLTDTVFCSLSAWIPAKAGMTVKYQHGLAPKRCFSSKFKCTFTTGRLSLQLQTRWSYRHRPWYLRRRVSMYNCQSGCGYLVDGEVCGLELSTKRVCAMGATCG